jgi:hypothetical protein
MQIIIKMKQVIFVVILFVSVAACKKNITEFGNDAAISGSVKDQSGSIVAGNITSNNLVVQALGENDLVTTVMRVKGDGMFENTRLFPKKYKMWITGPVKLVGDTILVDFSTGKTVVKDIVVIPFIAIKPPVAGNVTTSTIDLSFDITPTGTYAVSTREVYCSTNPYPDANTGSGPNFDTKKVTLTSNKGNITITGLAAKKKYYIRIGAQATGVTGLNYSEQISTVTM